MVILNDQSLAGIQGDVMPVGYDDGTLGTLHLVDEDGRELPDGEAGELLTEGDYVSIGYHNRPDLTAKAFYVAPDGTRGYRTGDLMYRRDGYYYCGRKDNLVKVGGYRVELEDVESNLRRVDIVETCAVVPAMRGSSVVMLADYVTLSDASRSKIAAIGHIKRELSKLVQAYMVPQKIVILDILPKNNSDKIDRAKLKQEAALQ